MGTTPSIGDGIERLAIQRVLDYVHTAKQRGRSSFPLAVLAEDTGIDPNTAGQVMRRLESGGPYTVRRVNPELGEVRWHVTGSAYELGGWNSDVWNARE